MTEEEAASVRCLSFESEDLILALAESVYQLHQTFSSNALCFDPFEGATEDIRQGIVGKIASVINSCFGVFFGQGPDEKFEGDLFLQVSTFCERLAKDHIFTDGNKRTALVMSLAMLWIRGIVVDGFDSANPETNEVYRWIQDVVSGEKTGRELAVALREMAHFGSYMSGNNR